MAPHWRSPDGKPGNRDSKSTAAIVRAVIVAVMCLIVFGVSAQFLAKLLGS